MNFQSCTIVIPVIREMDLFEQVVGTILDTCSHDDLEEFIIIVHPQYTAKESYESIKKMQKRCQEENVKYRVLKQVLPGMGGAMRDGIDAAKGSHVIIHNADMASDPGLTQNLIECAKKYPADITIVSRHMKSGHIEKGYDKFKLAWNILAQKYCAILYHSKVTDFTYAYRICPTEYYHAVNWEELKHPFTLESTLKFLRLGIKFHEIPGCQIGGTQSGYVETLSYLPTSLKVRFMKKSRILKPGIELNTQNK